MTAQSTAEPMHEYLFDVKLFAAIRVTAASMAEARATLRDCIECAEGRFGELPDGTPIVGEVSIDDEEMPCIEIDGEAA